MNLPIIKTLWIGDRLGTLEQLSLTSFVKCGHAVELYTYGDVAGIPKNVTVRNAEDILSESKIFRHKNNGSFATFADWFRYEMLHKHGGIWVDTDVVCLKPFDFDLPLLFAKEGWNSINNAVLGANAGHELLAWMAKQASHPNDILPYDTRKDKQRKFKRKYLYGNKRGNISWGEAGPTGLTRAAHHFNLIDKALPHTSFYPIHPGNWESIFDETFPDIEKYFPDSYAIHLWNEMMKQKPGFDKNGTFPEGSLIECLKRRYDIGCS